MQTGNSSITAPPKRDLKYLPLSALQRWDHQRDIREPSVDEIAESIEQTGYNPAKPMRVFATPSGYQVVAGGHRLAALQELGVGPDFEIPCVVEPDSADKYEVAVTDNRNDESATPDDLFDYLDKISQLRDNHTQKEIGEKLGWTRSKVNNHIRLLKKVDTRVLDIARSYQEGRVSENDTSVSFTEGWFRDSGLYDLDREGTSSWAESGEEEPVHAQVRLMRWFCEEKNCNTSKRQVQKQARNLLEVAEQLDTVDAEVDSGVEQGEVSDLKESVLRGEFTDNTLASAIQNVNEEAQNRAVFGADGIEGMKSLGDNSVDCVVTDPPYGVGYASHRSGIMEDFDGDKASYVQLLDAAFSEMRRCCKANAHLYIFFPMRHYTATVAAANEHFDVTDTPLIWEKNNHAPTRDATSGFDKMYAHKYESILVCRMPNGKERPLNVDGVEDNIFEAQTPKGQNRWHDTQKPTSLLQRLIRLSTGTSETVLDPFAGGGSTLLAAQKAGRHYVGFEKSDDEKLQSRFKREMRKLQNA